MSDDVEHNSLGEIILPVYLDGITETRVALSQDPKQFLDAFGNVASRESLILRVLYTYLSALPAEHVERLVPVLRAMGQRRATRLFSLEEIEAERARRRETRVRDDAE